MTDAANKHLKKHILIVDDDPSILVVLEFILKNTYEVTTALGGTKALEILKQDEIKFSAIVTDFNMPDISGEDVYNYILKYKPNLTPFIIFMTGGINVDEHKSFINQIKNPILEKPFSKETILASLAALWKN